MPFKSKAQRRALHAKDPELAERWEREGNTPKNLPEKKKAPPFKKKATKRKPPPKKKARKKK